MARKSRNPKLISQTSTEKSSRQKIYRAALYARLSVETKEQIEADTIGSQISLLMDYANSNDDIIIYDIYCDENVTGTNFERPAFEKMMRHMREKKIDCIIVKDLSRFGRNYLEAGNYIERVFPFFQVRFIAINDHFDNLNDNGNIVIPVKNIANQRYARDISEKICGAMQTLQKNGQFAGNKPPYGYVLAERNKHQFVVDEAAARIVRKIFESVSEGETIYKIVQMLNAEQIPSPGRHFYNKGFYKHDKYKNAVWTKEAVTHILKNEIYLGCMIGGKYKSEFLKTGKKKIAAVPRSEWIIVEGTHEPIIDRTLFEKVQQLNKARARVYFENKGKNDKYGKEEALLKGKLICGECGKSMVFKRKIQNKKAVFHYICYVHDHYGSSYCKKKGILKNDLENTIYLLIKKQIALFLEVDSEIKKRAVSKGMSDAKFTLQETMNRYARDIEKYTAMKREAYSDYKAQIISKDDFVDIKEFCTSKITELHSKTCELELKNASEKDGLMECKNWMTQIQKYQESTHLTREMVEAFIEKITIYDNGNMDIVFCYQDEYEQICGMYEEILKGRDTIAG